MVQFVHDIINNLDDNDNHLDVLTDLIIIDIDKVPHRKLLHKLDLYGIHKYINLWLFRCTQQVVVDGQASFPVPVLSRAPQGSDLGSILVILFINDLADSIRSFDCR